MYPIKQSTAITVPFFVHDAAGDAVTGLVDAGFTKRISKGSGAFAAMTVIITEMENGWYSFPLSTTHSDTLGLLTIVFTHGSAKQANLQWRIEARLLDDLAYPTVSGRSLDVAAGGEAGIDLGNVTGVLGNANVGWIDGSNRVDVGLWLGTAVATPTVAGVPEVDSTHLGGVAQSLLDLKDFADAGYDPATNKITGCVLTDTVTANTDMRGTDSAALASVLGALADAAATGDPTAVDTVMQYVKQLVNVLVGTAGIATMPTPLDPANGVNLFEMLRAAMGVTFAGPGDSLETIAAGIVDVQFQMGTGGAGLTDLGGMSTAMKAEVNLEVDAALIDAGLVLQVTTITGLVSQTVFNLTAGSADNEPYIGCLAVITDVATGTQKALGIISDYVGATKTVTLREDPGIFVMANTDNIAIVAVPKDVLDILADVTGIGGAAMRGTDSAALASVATEARLAELDAANLPADIAAIPTTAMRGTDSAALASVCTEARLAELDAANLPTDIAVIPTTAMRGTDNAALASEVTAARMSELDAATGGKMANQVDLIKTEADKIALADAGAGVAGSVIEEVENRATPAQVNTEVVDVIDTDTSAEPGQGAPPATASLRTKVDNLYKSWRNKKTNDGSTTKLFADDTTTVDAKQTTSEAGGTVTKDEWTTGP